MSILHYLNIFSMFPSKAILGIAKFVSFLVSPANISHVTGMKFSAPTTEVSNRQMLRLIS